MNREVCYDDHWIETFWNEASYFMHGQNNIIQVQGLLDSIGCTYRMTTIGEMNRLGTDMPDAPQYGETTQEKVDIYVDFPAMKVYNNTNKNWLEPLGLFSWKRKDDTYTFYDPKTKNYWTEFHPSHWQHFAYANEILRPSLGLPKQNNDKQIHTMEKLNHLKDTKHDLISFEDAILEEIVDYKHIGYIGF